MMLLGSVKTALVSFTPQTFCVVTVLTLLMVST